MATIAGSLRTRRQSAWLTLACVIALACALAAAVDPVALVALGLVLALFAATARSPDLAVMVVLFVGFTNASDILERYHSVPSLTQPLVFLVLVAIAARWAREGTSTSSPGVPSPAAALFPLVVAFVGLQLMSAWWAADPGRAIGIAGDNVREVLLALIIATAIRDLRGLRLAIWSVIAAGTAMATVAVVQYTTSSFTSTYGGFGRATIESIVGTIDNYRLSGPFDDPNFFALILLLVVPLAVDRALHDERLGLRVTALLAAAMCVLAIVFTFSRGGFIGLVAVGVIMLVRERPSAKVLFTAAALVIAVLVFAPPQYTSRLRTISQALPGSGSDLRAPTADISIRGRASEVTVGVQMFADHPFIGVGAANYENHYQEYARRLALDPRREDREAHDLYVEVAAELGVVGLVLFGAFVVLTRRRLRTARRLLAPRDRDASNMVAALGVSLVAYLVGSLFLHAAYTRPVWMLVGVAWATPAVAANAMRSK